MVKIQETQNQNQMVCSIDACNIFFITYYCNKHVFSPFNNERNCPRPGKPFCTISISKSTCGDWHYTYFNIFSYLNAFPAVISAYLLINIHQVIFVDMNKMYYHLQLYFVLFYLYQYILNN